MKIIHVIPSLQKGGAERLVLDICHELHKRKIEYILIVLSEINEYKYLSKGLNIQVCNSRVVPSISGKGHIDTKDFDAIINEFKPDIIHTHLFIAELVARENIISNVKYFSHVHDNMKQLNKLSLKSVSKEAITNFYEKIRIKKKYKECNNQFIAISKNAKDFISNAFKNRFEVKLLHNAINFKRFYNNQKTYTSTEMNLVTTGSLVDKKNQIFLIDVVKELKEKNYKVKLHILGEGSNRLKIENAIKKHSLQKEIFLHGNVDKVEEFLWNSFLYVHPAIYEPFGLVILEAEAAGLPTICLDGKGNRDIIFDDYNGYMIKDNTNYIAFTEKIIELWNNQEKYKSLSNNAIELARKYDISNYVDKLLGVYSI